MNRKTAREIIKKKLNSDLYYHSLRVEETAAKLASAHNVDEEKAALAGILHDYGKSYTEEWLIELALQFQIVDDITLHEPPLLHAPVGSWLLEREEGVKDTQVLEAVRTHTTGSENMDFLAQVVYLSDYIEPGRNCPGVSYIREIAYSDLSLALLYAVDLTIRYVLDRQRIVHPDSISFRNSLVISLRKGRRETYGHEAI